MKQIPALAEPYRYPVEGGQVRIYRVRAGHGLVYIVSFADSNSNNEEFHACGERLDRVLDEAASRLASLATRILLPDVRGVHDPLSGFFACRRELLLESAEDGYKVLLDLLTRRGLKVVEVPFIFVPRRSGSSKLDGGEAIRLLRLLATKARARGERQ